MAPHEDPKLQAALDSTIERIRQRGAAERVVLAADKSVLEEMGDRRGPEQWIGYGRAAAQMIVELPGERLLTLVTLGLGMVTGIDEDLRILADRYIENGGQ